MVQQMMICFVAFLEWISAQYQVTQFLMARLTMLGFFVKILAALQ